MKPQRADEEQRQRRSENVSTGDFRLEESRCQRSTRRAPYKAVCDDRLSRPVVTAIKDLIGVVKRQREREREKAR